MPGDRHEKAPWWGQGDFMRVMISQSMKGADAGTVEINRASTVARLEVASDSGGL